MRLFAITLAALIVLLQWPLWVGKGSWLKVWQIEAQLAQQQRLNSTLRIRNEALDAEVRDLKTGTDAIEERARSELGLIRPEEVFFQVLGKSPAPIPASPETARPGLGASPKLPAGASVSPAPQAQPTLPLPVPRP